jgi:hypothetical protein
MCVGWCLVRSKIAAIWMRMQQDEIREQDERRDVDRPPTIDDVWLETDRKEKIWLQQKLIGPSMQN